MIKDNYGKFRNVANALVEDELASTYVWILQCLTKLPIPFQNHSGLIPNPV